MRRAFAYAFGGIGTLEGRDGKACLFACVGAADRLPRWRAFLVSEGMLVPRVASLHVVENDHAPPHQAEMDFGQLGARHWPAIIVATAFPRIPRMRPSGADGQPRQHKQTDKLSNLDPQVS